MPDQWPYRTPPQLGSWQIGGGVTLHKTDKAWWQRVWPWTRAKCVAMWRALD